MKNIKFLNLFFTVILLFTVNSCDDDLDINVTDSFASDLVLSTPDQVELLLFSTYNSTESWGLNKSKWWTRRFNIENASFESKFNFNNLDILGLRRGWTAGNVGFFGDKWSTYWTYVRQANLFFELVEGSPAQQADPERVAVLVAEMKFLRANLYSKLIKFYGGVPIITTAASLDDNFNIPRNTYEECVDFIVKELDEAAAVLPLTQTGDNFGRASKLAALAVKSRTLLYAASDLHDPAMAPQATNLEFYTYSKGSKWQDAADAAKAVIDLVGARDLIAVGSADAYQKLFLSPNDDIIFARPYGSQLYDFGTDANSLWDKTQSPRGFDGWALSSPTHNYILQYNMADGTTTEGATYDPMNPNTGREMRYYANINFQGAQFRGREIDYALSVDNTVVPDGKDSESQAQAFGNFRHASKTGYNIRKFQDESIPVTGISANRPFILYRLAEIYLNYAEAQARLGNDGEARTYLNKVSARALQPAITASGAELLEAIYRERRVELAFEGHSFFDERRWMFEDHLGFEVRGLRWTKQLDESLTFEEYTVVTRPWETKQYYLPIPLSEVEKAPALIQNDGY
ncbi:RagB/SusD family nutrient uptake outer membrane protein [Hyunsoonleella sp. SJ7]|uniref:RagB/SusD family nutrient uptake outer membrane protein n=1 Tax=Hyunsoonleella aquatilis TaxID=2762758 RepID=A0A923HFA8_9FLAO|nr:RagB/SusD family nutrient uptake outer membrane protein [Hyunsoonleella aquatilis]MBC3759208.1 RagB/SusD family nutrient uptake outer membrane protein [Hyunsoonleella aquatilis]